MAFIDYYKILGVDRNIPQDQVREAYRKRAKQFHPDLHPNDPKAKAKFQALNEAYDVISDPEKRKKYDSMARNGARLTLMLNKVELAELMATSTGARMVEQVEEALLSRASTSRDSELERVASQVSSRTFLEPRQVARRAHATAHARIVAR